TAIPIATTVFGTIRSCHTLEELKANQGTITQIVNVARDKIDPALNINVEIVNAKDGDVYVVHIPRLSRYPHAVKQEGAKMYFIRRQDRIDVPSNEELQQLFSSPELVPTYVPPTVLPEAKEDTDPSASVREVALTVYIGTLLLFSYAVSRPIMYLFGYATGNLVGFDIWPFLVGVVVVMGLASYSYFSLGKDFLFTWRNVGPIVILVTVVELITAAVAFGTSEFYSSYFRGSILPFWLGYLGLAVESVLLSLVGFAAVEVTLPSYLTRIIELAPKRYRELKTSDPQSARFAPLGTIRQHKKVVAITLIIALIIPGGLGGSDLSFHLFTPDVQTTVVPNTLSLVFNGYYNASYLMSLLTTSSLGYRNSSQPNNCNASYFEPFNETLSIRVPLLQVDSINNITVINPSNVSTYASPSYGSTYYYSYSPYSILSWQSLGIIDSNNAWISAMPTDKPVQQLDVGFSNGTRGTMITIGLRYYKLEHPAVACTEADYYYVHGNSSLIVHQFEIMNMGTSVIAMDSVIARDFNGLNIYPANVTITVNGKPMGIVDSSYDGYPNSDYSLWYYPIVPHTNVTLVVEGNSSIV
ncbi:MAG: ATP-binding protein, partial [Thaumarchaeota archaeon]|nr:ATP-binding protein [Nitrososphaerota archaeon]